MGGHEGPIFQLTDIRSNMQLYSSPRRTAVSIFVISVRMDAFEEHNRDCDSILDPGTQRLRDLEADILAQDAAFMKELKRLEADFDLLARETTNSLADLERVLREELASAESDLQNQRKKDDELHRARLDELFESRRDAEVNKYLVALVSMMRTFQSEEEELQRSLRLSYDATKSELVSKASAAEIRVEELKASQCIEQHNLDHSVYALSERIASTKAQQRKTRVEMVRLHAIRNSMREEYHKSQSQSRETNRKLTAEIGRLQQSYETFLRKFAEIEKVNAIKYERVRKSDEQEIKRLGDLLKKRIRGIYTNVLCREWAEPPSIHGESQERCMQCAPPVFPPSSESRFSVTTIKRVLDLIESEASFLAIKGQGPEFAKVEKIRAILTYLGIETASDLDSLVSLFLKDEGNEIGGSVGDATEVIDILNRFVERGAERRAVGKADLESAEKRKNVALDEEALWTKLGSPVSSEEIHILQNMIPRLEEFLKHLQRRKHLLEKREALHACT